MEEGSLYSYVKAKKKLSEQETSKKLYEICSAVKKIH